MKVSVTLFDVKVDLSIKKIQQYKCETSEKTLYNRMFSKRIFWDKLTVAEQHRHSNSRNV